MTGRSAPTVVFVSAPPSRSRSSRLDLVAAYMYLAAAALCGFSGYASARMIGWWGCVPWLALGVFCLGKFYVEIRRLQRSW
jgi:hypothetical protein